MNKVLLWSLIVAGALIIIVVLVISGSNVATLGGSFEKVADNASKQYNRWAGSEECCEPEMMETPASDGINGFYFDSGNELVPVEDPEYKPDENAKPDNDTDKTENNTQTNAKNRRKMIYTADYMIHVKDYETGIAKAKSFMSDYQGYVSLQTNTRLIVRIPAEYFDDFTAALEKLGKVITRNIKALEVTEQYNDLKMKIDALEKSIADWEAKRKTVKTDAAMIEIDKIIDRKLQELAGYKGKMRYLVDQISFSTITIDFTMDPTPPPTAPRHRFNVPYNWMRYLDVENLLGDHSYQDDYED